jgi:hypothetical protein
MAGEAEISAPPVLVLDPARVERVVVELVDVFGVLLLVLLLLLSVTAVLLVVEMVAVDAEGWARCWPYLL